MPSPNPLNTAIGTNELCAWQPVLGIVWIQARNPDYAKKLSQRDDSKLVARGVAGGYLRTYEFQNSLTWAKRLMERYTMPERVTGKALRPLKCPRTHPDSRKDS